MKSPRNIVKVSFQVTSMNSRQLNLNIISPFNKHMVSSLTSTIYTHSYAMRLNIKLSHKVCMIAFLRLRTQISMQWTSSKNCIIMHAKFTSLEYLHKFQIIWAECNTLCKNACKVHLEPLLTSFVHLCCKSGDIYTN